VTDAVVRGPLGAPGRGGPLIGTEFPENCDKPPPLGTERLEQVLWVEAACTLGAQKQLAWLDLSWQWAAINHTCLPVCSWAVSLFGPEVRPL
jgi:hypothetical protein